MTTSEITVSLAVFSVLFGIPALLTLAIAYWNR